MFKYEPDIGNKYSSALNTHFSICPIRFVFTSIEHGWNYTLVLIPMPGGIPFFSLRGVQFCTLSFQEPQFFFLCVQADAMSCPFSLKNLSGCHREHSLIRILHFRSGLSLHCLISTQHHQYLVLIHLNQNTQPASCKFFLVKTYLLQNLKHFITLKTSKPNPKLNVPNVSVTLMPTYQEIQYFALIWTSIVDLTTSLPFSVSHSLPCLFFNTHTYPTHDHIHLCHGVSRFCPLAYLLILLNQIRISNGGRRQWIFWGLFLLLLFVGMQRRGKLDSVHRAQQCNCAAVKTAGLQTSSGTDPLWHRPSLAGHLRFQRFALLLYCQLHSAPLHTGRLHSAPVRHPWYFTSARGAQSSAFREGALPMFFN